MEVICPNCGAVVDFDSEFENFEDNGDYVEGSATLVCCNCDEMFRVRAFFNWDGNLEVD
jgi:hypothetical protein